MSIKLGHILPMNHFEIYIPIFIHLTKFIHECVNKFPEKKKKTIALFSIFFLKLRCNLFGNDVDISFLLIKGVYMTFVYFVGKI